GTAYTDGSGRDDGSLGDRVASAHLHHRTSGAIVVAEHANDLVSDRGMSRNENIAPRNGLWREEWRQSLVAMRNPGEVVEHALVDAKGQARQRRARYSDRGLHQQEAPKWRVGRQRAPVRVGKRGERQSKRRVRTGGVAACRRTQRGKC